MVPLFDSLSADLIDVWMWNSHEIPANHNPFLNLLFRYTGITPCIQKGAHGKPFLVDHPLQFNLTHSGNMAMLAMSTTPVGIDVEQEKDRLHMEGLSAKIFTEKELAIYRESSDRKRTFYEGWTKKEAFLKAIGTGISYGLKRCSVPFESDWAQVACQKKEGAWFCKPLTVNAGYQAAICSQLPKKLRMMPFS